MADLALLVCKFSLCPGRSEIQGSLSWNFIASKAQAEFVNSHSSAASIPSIHASLTLLAAAGVAHAEVQDGTQGHTWHPPHIGCSWCQRNVLGGGDLAGRVWGVIPCMGGVFRAAQQVSERGSRRWGSSAPHRGWEPAAWKELPLTEKENHSGHSLGIGRGRQRAGEQGPERGPEQGLEQSDAQAPPLVGGTLPVRLLLSPWSR